MIDQTKLNHTKFSAVFWKRLWVFTVLTAATIVMSLPAVGAGDLSESVRFVSSVNHRSASQQSAPVQSSGFVIIDQFDGHLWADAGAPNSRPGTYQFAPSRAFEGNQALKITAPIQPLVEESPALNQVILSPARELVQAEDWSAVRFVTLDAYLEEQPADFPELELTLINSAGDRFTTRALHNGAGTLNRWKNREITFPIQGIQGMAEAAPVGILTDVNQIEIGIVGYNEPLPKSDAEAEAGLTLSELSIHLDNFKLNGTIAWDTFEGADNNWKPAGDVSTTAGITHNKSWNNSAGSLFMGWQYGGSNPEAIVSTSQISPELDWGSYNYIQAQIWVDNPEIPFSVRLTDSAGNQAITPASNSTLSRGWTAVAWPIPKQAEIDFAAITQLEIFVTDISVFQEGESYIDELVLVQDVGQPYDIKTRVLAGKNEIEWTNPNKPEIGSVAVYGDTAGHPLSVGSGTQICQVSAVPAVGQCVHEGVNPGETWFYSVFPLQEGAVLATSEMGQLAAVQNQILIRPEGSQLELAISPGNGAILYIRDTATGKNHSTGSLSNALWQINFADENVLPSLSAADFSPDSESARFSYSAEPPSLNYAWSQGDQTLSLQIKISSDSSDSVALQATIDNQTGLPIRSVSLPHELGFSQTGLRHALLPLGEGLTLLPSFFAEQRSTGFDRPELFADLLAIESDSGDLAITMLQDSLYQADLITGHNLADPVFQPHRLSYGSTRKDGFMQVDMLALIPSGQTWQSGTLKLHINQNFQQIAQQYTADNQLDQNQTLAEKLAPWGTFDTLAQSPIYFLDASKAIEWEKAAPGLLWQSVADEWLAELEAPGLIQFYHWQQSADPASGLPGAQPIWTDKYGPEVDLTSLLEALEQNGFMSMPSTDWTVWSDPTLRATVPASATLSSLRGVEFPHASGTDGVLMAPWRPELQSANDDYFELYSTQLPQTFMFASDAAGEGARYTLLGDGVTGSAAAYTTAALSETGRLSQNTPIFTDAAVDVLAQSVTGFNQSVHSQRMNGDLLHLGEWFQSYSTYPLAAHMVHTQVAFYPDGARTDSWGSANKALFTHYILFGYNQTADLSRHFGETDWLRTTATYQKAVSQRTFGQPLSAHDRLTNDQTVIETTWGSGNGQISIIANFDPEQTEKTFETPSGYTIAPDGFHAMSLDGDVTAGIYSGTFNKTPLTAGDHWLVVERQPRQISVKQLDGASTPIGVDRPRSWRDTDKINMLQIMSNGSARVAQADQITADKILFTYNQNLSVLNTTEYLIFYGELDQLDLSEYELLSEEDVESLITEVNSWRSDIDNPLEWRFSTITLQTGSSNSMVLRENNPDESFGKIESAPFEFDFGFDIEAKLGATIIPPGASVSIALLDEDTGESVQLLTAENEGTFTGRVADVADWREARTVRVQIWVSGEDTPVSLDYVEIYPLSVVVNDPVVATPAEETSNDDPPEEVTIPSNTDSEAESEEVSDLDETAVDEPESTEEPIQDDNQAVEDETTPITEPAEDQGSSELPTGPELPETAGSIIWEESFGPLDKIWIPSGVKIETSSAGALVITENAPDQGFGRIEGETLSVNLLDYPLLRLNVLDVAPGTGFTIQVQEQGNAYDFFDAIQSDQPGEYEINLLELTGWNDNVPHDFRILIWVSGEGGSLTVDNLAIGR